MRANIFGHDDPSVLFYSNVPGSGNSNVYVLTLPKDPPNLPKQDGTGGTFNFQLHPAFWIGMALCDSQSAPNPGQPCTPNSDSNIFDSADKTAPDYIGKHPGTAFMQIQFYPPGWVPWPPGNSCDPTKWCAALNIFSFSVNLDTRQFLNPTCANVTGNGIGVRKLCVYHQERQNLCPGKPCTGDSCDFHTKPGKGPVYEPR